MGYPSKETSTSVTKEGAPNSHRQIERDEAKKTVKALRRSPHSLPIERMGDSIDLKKPSFAGKLFKYAMYGIGACSTIIGAGVIEIAVLIYWHDHDWVRRDNSISATIEEWFDKLRAQAPTTLTQQKPPAPTGPIVINLEAGKFNRAKGQVEPLNCTPPIAKADKRACGAFNRFANQFATLLKGLPPHVISQFDNWSFTLTDKLTTDKNSPDYKALWKQDPGSKTPSIPQKLYDNTEPSTFALAFGVCNQTGWRFISDYVNNNKIKPYDAVKLCAGHLTGNVTPKSQSLMAEWKAKFDKSAPDGTPDRPVNLLVEGQLTQTWMPAHK